MHRSRVFSSLLPIVAALAACVATVAVSGPAAARPPLIADPASVAGPAPVTHVRTSVDGPNRVTVNWRSSTSANVAAVVVRRQAGTLAPMSSKDGVLVARLGALHTSFIDFGVTANHIYTYAVFVRDAAGRFSRGTASAPAATPAAPAAPAWSDPTMIDPTTGYPSAVSCATVDRCVLLDLYGGVIQFQDGAWGPREMLPDSQAVWDLSCPSTTFCMGVAYTGAVSFDGDNWSSAVPIDPGHEVHAVSCVSSAFCAAVDHSGNALTFNGTSWSAPVATGGGWGGGISCVSPSFCVAAFGSGLFTYNGTTWTQSVTGPYWSVDCASATFCVAGGSGGKVAIFTGTWGAPVDIDDNQYSQVEHMSCASATFCLASDGGGGAFRYDGAQWADVTPLDLAPTDISCPSTSRCVATDVYDGKAAGYDGATWSKAQYVDPWRGAPDTVSCPTMSFCLALDTHTNHNPRSQVTFDGNTWTDPHQVPLVRPSGATCLSATFCITLDAIYDGQTWTPLPAADYQWSQAEPECATPTFCIAVTEAGVFTFKGTGWVGPRQAAVFQSVSAASCASPSFCAAVGNDSAILFDGSGWSAPTKIDAGGFAGSAMDVSCTSKTFCMTVDHKGRATRWDGRRWSRLAVIDPGEWLQTIHCTSRTWCVALDRDNFVLEYDGAGWTQPLSIDPGHDVMSISCAASTFCMAVDISGRAIQGP